MKKNSKKIRKNVILLRKIKYFPFFFHSFLSSFNIAEPISFSVNISKTPTVIFISLTANLPFGR